MQLSDLTPKIPSTRLVHVTTIPMTLEFFLKGQIGWMKERGFEVVAVSSPGPALDRVAERDKIAVYAVPMKRSIAPVSDLVALIRLARLFRKIRPAVVHSSTGKAGPLAMIAAALVRVPIRFYSLRGIMVDRRSGLAKILLKALERVSCLLADRVLAVSQSVAEVVTRDGYCPAAKLAVPATGSSNGVEAVNRFNPALVTSDGRELVRKQYNIPGNAFVIGFVGRLVAGKGIRELEKAWQEISRDHDEVFLVTVGEPEAQDPVPEEVLVRLAGDERVKMIDYLPNEEMPLLYSSLDLVVLPTYSEGFPNVVLEAAAMELPVVATRVTGCVDAVQDGITGLLVNPRDWQSLAESITCYIGNRDLGRRHGRAGRERVLRLFRPELVWESVYQEYREVLTSKGFSCNRSAVLDRVDEATP